ncbi:MAG TPA: hypothetical protein VF178_14765 [Gemmatimonadaceae bacterium]
MTPVEASFAFAFLLGIAGAVYVIIRGVERPRRRGSAVQVDDFGREMGVGFVSLRAPTIAACLMAAGLVGYPLARFTTMPIVALVAVAAGAAVLAGPVAARLVRRWAYKAATQDATDPRYLLQGHIAMVVRDATEHEPAQVEYTANGRRVIAPAKGIDTDHLVPGTEVVIDRLEDGVVYVEPWGRVEQRI